MRRLVPLLTLVLAAGLMGAAIFWPASNQAEAQTVPPSAVLQCPAGTTLSTPFPQNANGEFLLVNAFCITGPGTVTISLNQVLTNPSVGISADELTQIRTNPALLSVWRQGSWFLTASTYNAATATFTFTAESGTNIYAFFYGAITRPIGTDQSLAPGTVPPGSPAGAGGIEEALTEASTQAPFRAGLFSSGFLALIGSVVLFARQRMV